MGDEYGMSPFQMIQMMGPMMIVGPMLLWLLVIGPLLIYPLARWKAHREPVLDTQLGIKVALHYFQLIAFQMLLVGGVMLLWTIISKVEDKGEFYRAAFGFLVPAGIVFAAHMVLLKRTNDDQFPNVRRLFLGYNLMVVGLIGFIVLVAGFQALFAKGSSGDMGRLFLAAVLVYCGAWAACGIQFGRLVMGGYSNLGGPPGNVMTPPAPQPPQAQQSGLPPLSSGAYPPISSND